MSSSNPAFAAHLPRFVLEALAKHTPQSLSGRVTMRRAAAMFCDISGFTPLCETLGRQGKAGTEELTIQLNNYFETLMGVIEGWGGDTVKFGGDAITVLFEAEDDEPLAIPMGRAAAAAEEVFQTLGVVRIAKTPWGEFPLSLKIGLSSGPLLTGLIGDWNDRMEPVVAGLALDRMADAEHHAKPGDIIVDLGAEGVVESRLSTGPAGEGFGKLLARPEGVQPPKLNRSALPPKERVQPFLLSAVWGQLEAGSEAMLGEHRQIVTVFVSFPGLDYMDPDSLAKLDGYFRKVQLLMKGFGGSFNRMDMGDKGSKFLGFFGAPESYEDNAERAIAFALALHEIEKEVTWAKGQRIGLSLGTNFCGVMGSSLRREYTVMGDAVNIAARLMGAAKPSEALAVKALREKTRHRFKWGRYRALTLKGKSEPIQVSPPLGSVKQKSSQGAVNAVALVGRETELKRIRAARARAGKGPVPFVVIQGEAGIGKTALLQAALAEAREQGWRTALGACQAIGAGPLQVWVEIFRTLLAVEHADRETLESRLHELLPDQAEFLGMALRFLGFHAPLSPAAESLEPKERFEKTADLLARALAKMADEKPVVVGLDGLSHADAATKDLLGGIVGRVRGARVAFIGASRAGLDLPGSPKDLPLGGLVSAEVRQLAIGLLGAARITDAFAEFLVERTGGNPLFLGELVQNLRERGAVVTDREGRIQFKADQVGDIPGSIEGLLLSRIDRLPLVTRNVLKVAACLGNSFDLTFLQSVFQPKMSEADMAGHLRAVEELGLVPTATPASATIPGGQKFSFLHATLRETAYNGVLLANRRSIHRSAAEWLESHGDQADPSLLAYHFGQAEVWDKALQYGLKAGFAAVERYAFKEAAQLFGEVLVWSQKCGMSIEAVDRMRIADAFLQAGQPQRCQELLDTLLKEPLGAEDRLMAGEAYLRLLESRGQHAECIEMAKTLIREARKIGKVPQAHRASRFMVSSLFRLGQQEDALAEIRQVKAELSMLDEERASFDILEGAILLQRGEVGDAASRYETALAWARASQHLPLQLRAAIGMANALRGSRDLPGSLACAQEAMELARKAGSRFNILGATITCSNAFNLLGRHEAAAHLLEENIDHALQEAFPYAACSYLNELGVTSYYQQRFKDAVRYYRASLKIAQKNKDPQQQPVANYNIADALRAMKHLRRAQQYLRRALRGARVSQNPPLFVLAARDLIAIAREQGVTLNVEEMVRFIRWQLRLWKHEDLLSQVLAEEAS